MKKQLLFAASVAMVLAGPVRAQEMPESYRAVQMRALELQRRSLLQMAEGNPAMQAALRRHGAT